MSERGKRGPAADASGAEALAREVALDRMCQTLARIEAPLDEVGRARSEARLRASMLANQASADRSGLAATRSRRKRFTITAVAAGAIAALGLGLFTLRPRPTATSTAARGPALFNPYLVAPAGPALAGNQDVPASLTSPSARLDVPRGWLVRARVGRRATITALGPTRLSIEGPETAPTLTIATGRLIGEFEGGGDARLFIATPDAVTTVVGTLFAIAAGDGETRISIAHGRVRVATAHDTWEVGDGQSRSTGEPSAATLAPDAEVAANMAEHHRIAPPAGPTLPVKVSGAGGQVFIDGRPTAVAPVWLQVQARSEVRLATAGYEDVTWRAPVVPEASPRGDRMQDAGNTPGGSPPLTVLQPISRVAAQPLVPRTSTHRGSASRRAFADGSAGPNPSRSAENPPSTDRTEADDLYRRADRSLAAGDRAGARKALRALVAQFGRTLLADDARYELARMAHGDGDEAAALDQLAAIRATALDEPVHFLRCRALVAQKAAHDAEECLVSFRHRFPGSPHDPEALGALAALHFDRGGCAALAASREELTRRYPDHPSTAKARDACPASPAINVRAKE